MISLTELGFYIVSSYQFPLNHPFPFEEYDKYTEAPLLPVLVLPADNSVCLCVALQPTLHTPAR